jgi:hypothetical protein
VNLKEENSGNVYYHSVQNVSFYHLLYRNIKIKIYRTIMLLVIMYGCETWQFTLTEEHRLRVTEKRVLKKIYGPEWEEVTGDWRKLHNEEVHHWCISPNIVKVIISRRIRWVGHVAGIGEKCIQVFGGKT